MNEFLKYLENSNEEIFIDTVGANHDASVKYLYEYWTKKGNAYYWFNQNYINDASVVSYFIVNSKQPRPYIGSVVGSGKIVTSYPVLLYGDNLAGVCSTDKDNLFGLIKKSFDKNSMLIPASCRNFGDFKLQEIDFSVSFELNSEEECDEAFRLFESKRFPNHHVNIEGGTQGTYAKYDYDDGVCFGSYSDNIKMYDKTAEMLDDHDEDIQPYIMRIEINCFRDVKGVEFKGKSVNELFENANQWFLALLKKYNLIYDYLPEKDFFETIKSYLIPVKMEYFADKNKKEKNYPSYLKNDVEKTLSFLKTINEIGAEAAYREDHKLYNSCLNLTNELGIDILYTKLDRRFNFFENVIYRKNADSFFITEDATNYNGEMHGDMSSDCTSTTVKHICYYKFVAEYVLEILCLELKKSSTEKCFYPYKFISDYAKNPLCPNLKNLSIGKHSFYKLE